MALPLVPLALIAAFAFVASSSKDGGGDTRTDPNDLFDDNLPPAVRAAVEASITDPMVTWPGLVTSAYTLQAQGYDKTAATVLSVANAKRQRVGLGPIDYPITAAAYASAAAEAANAAPTNPGSVIPGPGGGLTGIGPTQIGSPYVPATTTTRLDPKEGVKVTTPTPAVPPFVPPTGGGSTITIPGLGNVVVTPGVMPGVTPSMPPPGVVFGTYPKGTHTRPDGTYGYTTQSGDYALSVIAKKFGPNREASALMSANPNTDWNHNPVGSDLNLPDSWINPMSPPPPGDRGKAPPKLGGAKAPKIDIDLDAADALAD